VSEGWDFECLSHDPAQRSDLDVNHGADLLERVFVLERGGLWPDVPVKTWPGLPADYPARVAAGDWPWGGPGDWLEPAPVVLPRSPRWPDLVLGPGPVLWLRAHPGCRVGLVSEYGERRDLPGGRGVEVRTLAGRVFRW